MKFGRRLPMKVMIVLVCAIALLVPVLGPALGLWGHKDPRARVLDAVAGDLAQDPRLAVLQVDHGTGQLLVMIKPTNQTLTFALTRVEAKTFPDGQAGEEWGYEWKDPAGRVVALGHDQSSPTKKIRIPVPGLTR